MRIKPPNFHATQSKGHPAVSRAAALCLAFGWAFIGCLIFATTGAVFVDFSGRSPAPLAVATDQPTAAPDAVPAPVTAVAMDAFRAARLGLPVGGTEVSIVAVGDIMLSRNVGSRIVKQGSDYPYRALDAYLRSADLTFGNLETPLQAGRPVVTGEMSFHSDPAQAAELRHAGFDVLSLANNHTPNAGTAGLANTLEKLSAVGIAPVGAGNDAAAAAAPAIVESHGLKFAFLAYTDAGIVPAIYGATATRPGTNFLDVERMRAEVAAVRPVVDAVIVSMHAGQEYVAAPGRQQQEFARAAIDAGADAVIGHHPHVVQTVERYHDKLIFYSLGNFIFDQDWSRATRDGLAVRLVWRDGSFRRAELLPVSIDLSQPRAAEGADAQRVLTRLKTDIEPRAAVAADSDRFVAKSVPTINIGQADGARRQRKAETVKLSEGPEVTVSLDDGQLLVSGRKVDGIGASDWVDDYALADLTGDGQPELLAAVWSTDASCGSATAKVTAAAPVGERLMAYRLGSGQPEALWVSGCLPSPICDWRVADLDADQRAEAVLLEGDYGDAPACLGRRLALRRWQGGGLPDQWRGADGAYEDLGVSYVGNQPLASVRSQATPLP